GRSGADDKGVQLQYTIDPAVRLISGDSDRLQQVVWNLVSNAIKFTPRGGRIRLTAKRVDDEIEISVSDSGRGISAEFLPHLFEWFRQAETGTARSYGGLGVGLAIVRRIVELHGGKIQAVSEGEGKGATLTVRLPLMPPSVAEPTMPRLR